MREIYGQDDETGAHADGAIDNLRTQLATWRQVRERQQAAMSSRLGSAVPGRGALLASSAGAGGDGATTVVQQSQSGQHIRVLDGGDVGRIVMGSTRPVVVPSRARAHLPMTDIPRMKDNPELAYAAGQFYLASIWGSERAGQWCKDHGVRLVKAQQIEGTDSLGGFLVPDELEATIIDLRVAYGVFRNAARLWPMGSDTKWVPTKVSGVTAKPVAEAAAIPEDEDVVYGRIELIARKWGRIVAMSEEVDADSLPDMGADLTRELARAFSLAEDTAGFNGDGDPTNFNTIYGITNPNATPTAYQGLAAGSVVETAAGSLLPSEVVWAEILALMSKPKRVPGSTRRWYCHESTYTQVLLRLMTEGGGNAIGDLREGSTPDDMGRFRFMGYAGQLTEVLPEADEAAGNAGDMLIIFGDLNMGSAFGDRRGLSVRATDVGAGAFETDLIKIKGRARFDIKTHSIGTATEAGVIGGLRVAAI